MVNPGTSSFLKLLYFLKMNLIRVKYARREHQTINRFLFLNTYKDVCYRIHNSVRFDGMLIFVKYRLI